MNKNILLTLILFFVIVLSKEILVFNEEILVLFAFGIFIFLVYNFGSSLISTELDSRSIKIKEEFDFYRNMQEKTLSNLIIYHNKQKLLSEEIKSIFSTIKKDIDLIIHIHSQLFVKSILYTIEEKLKKILTNESKFNSLLQEKISSELYSFLISKYSLSVDNKSSSLFLDKSIGFLSNLK